MNAKRAKAIRAQVRAEGKDLRQVLTLPASVVYWSPLETVKWAGRVKHTGQRRVSPQCGRGMYRDLKNSARYNASQVS